jgi:hypothetical protein
MAAFWNTHQGDAGWKRHAWREECVLDWRVMLLLERKVPFVSIQNKGYHCFLFPGRIAKD